ncbi:MAG: hypothetical protein K1X83_07165 [Oligoflexia bacterium]|nr:hypothetical protein [Oligoflexia bacterium]
MPDIAVPPQVKTAPEPQPEFDLATIRQPGRGLIAAAAAVARGSKTAADKTGTVADHALDALALEPGEEPALPKRVLRRIAEVAPILGPTKTFADARAKFTEGQATGNQSMIDAARGECLKACLELGVDLTFIPMSIAAKSTGRTARLVSALRNVAEASIVKKLTSLHHKLGFNVEQELTAHFLKSDSAQRTIDAMLRFGNRS